MISDDKYICDQINGFITIGPEDGSLALSLIEI
jgi:hypothetical protein